MLDVVLKVSIAAGVFDAVILAWVLMRAHKAKGGWYQDLD